MNTKYSQSLSHETGVHEAFLTRVGITINRQRSLTPLQAKKIPAEEPDTSLVQGKDKSGPGVYP